MGRERFEASDEALARAVAFAAESGTAQLVISRHGEVVVGEIFEAEPVDVYAVQKGVASVMFGIAEERGLLSLDDPVSDYLAAGWTQLPRAAEARLSIRAVLDMTTGMDDELRPLGEVGVSWRYDNISYNYLKTVLEVVTELTLNDLTQTWLLDPLGMDATRWVDRLVQRPDGRPITGLLSTARDLAKFGAMVLAGGSDIAPPDHVGSLGRPGSGENPAWGLCWWNNNQTQYRLPRRESDLKRGPMTPGAPADMIAARGAMENYLFVVPSLEMVVARTAKPVGRGQRPSRFDRPFWEAMSSS